jgi:hypothetical protein
MQKNPLIYFGIVLFCTDQNSAETLPSKQCSETGGQCENPTFTSSSIRTSEKHHNIPQHCLLNTTHTAMDASKE